MGNLVARIVSVIGGALLLLAMFGSGPASASGFIGMTWSEASSLISEKGGTAVVGTVMGDQVDLDACRVTSFHASIFLNSSGKNDRKHDFVFNLNCNNVLAAPGKPGNSSVSPEGVAAKKDNLTAARIEKNPAWCQSSDDAMKYCQRICKRTELCSI